VEACIPNTLSQTRFLNGNYSKWLNQCLTCRLLISLAGSVHAKAASHLPEWLSSLHPRSMW
jgi:hypothetical protein